MTCNFMEMKPEFKYGIIVCGVEVTSKNYNNITGDGIEGKVSYNPDTQTLILNNAIINGYIWFCVHDKENKAITINVVGESNYIIALDSVKGGTKIIKGPGVLEIGSCINCHYEKEIVIENCTLKMNTSLEECDWGIFCGCENTILTLINARISMEVLSIPVGRFEKIKLVDCESIKPINIQLIDNKVKDHTNN